MERRHPIALLITFVVLGCWALPGAACSPRSIPSPEQLVARADAIYLAEATEYVVPLNERKPGVAPLVTFRVLATIKGGKAPQLQFPAALNHEDDSNDGSVPYTFVRPGGRHGNCFAVTYRSGAKYLLFIKSGTPYWAPLAPTNEQVRGDDDAWVSWVQSAVSDVATRPN